MTLDITHWRKTYSQNVAQLAKGYDRSILKETCSREEGSGENHFIDHIGLPTDIDTRIADTSNPEAFKAIENVRSQRRHTDEVNTSSANETAANQAAMRTPHLEPNRQRTISAPQYAEWGHWMAKEDDVKEVLDLKSQKLRVGMKTIFRTEDYLVYSAVSAANVTRVSSGTSHTSSNVAFPAAQKVALEFENFGNLMTKDVLARIREKFSNNDALDFPIYALVSPKRARELIEQSGDTIHSTDFVRDAGFFERGDFPEIYGIRLIEHSLVGDSYVYAYQSEGLRWVNYSNLESTLDRIAHERNQYLAQMCEVADVKRVDDKRVVWANFETTSAS